MPEGQEFELKLTIEPGAVEALLGHPLLESAKAGRRLAYLISTYFDTPDLVLREQRLSLRLRKSEAGTRQTLKRETFSRIQRDEFESDTNGSEPDVAWLGTTPLAPVFEKTGVAEALEPQFTVEVARTVLPIGFEGAEIEGALDQGNIRAKGLSIPVNEFELELKAGSPEAVFSIARQLARSIPLVLGLATKAERGFGLRDLSWGHPTRSVAVSLGDGATIQDGFQEIVQACLHAIGVNAALIGGVEDEEAVHKTRVALRRLRAAFTLFKPAVRPEGYEALRREMKWLWARLGDARDADVFEAGLAHLANADEPGSGVAAIKNVTGSQCARAHRKLVKALASPRWRLMLLDLLAFSVDGVRPSAKDEILAPFAKSRLESRRRKLSKAAKGLKALPLAELHEIRKAAKSLRYSLEFFEDAPKLGGKKSFRRVGKRLETLQEALGTLNDDAALRERIRTTFVDAQPPNNVALDVWHKAVTAAQSMLDQPLDASKPMKKAAKAAEALAE